MKNKLGGVFAFGGMAWLALSVLAGCGAGDPGEDNGFDADEAPAVGEANSALATPETKVLDAFGSLHGFGDQNPRLVANLDYDNDSDIVAFGAGDIFVSHNLGNGVFTQPELAVAGFGCANQGWRTDLDERVMVDIDNDPTNDDDKDLFAFGGQGTYLLLAVGGMLQTPQWIVHDFGRAQGWRKDMHPRFVANIDSTKPRDLVGSSTMACSCREISVGRTAPGTSASR